VQVVRTGIGKGRLLGVLAVLVLASLPAQAAGDTLLIRGQLTHLARIALVPDSIAVVELREAVGDDAPIVAERRMALQGRQVPIPFELGVDRAALLPGIRYAVRGGVLVDGRPAWATEPLAVDTAAAVLELGELVMTPVRARGFTSTLRCGDLTITVGFLDDLLRLDAGGEAIDLKQVESASGALFSAGTEPPTTFWSKGDRATLVLHGVTWPECVMQQAAAPAFRAGGNEPGWFLVIDGAGLALTTRYGEERLTALGYTVETTGKVRRYRAEVDGRTVAVTVEDRLCTDTMSGMPHPSTVSVMVDEERLEGCGGEPLALLQEGEWVVEAIDGQPVMADSRPTLAFADGHVAGSASCNRYTGGFTLTGESLTVAQVATTMMACPPALMAQERLFLDVLAAVRGFALDPDGTLVLRTPDQRTLTARRA
jgi:prepilin-type processing-associated H-X9-DG protein